VHYVFGKINYGGLKHNSLYLGLVLPSGGWQSLIVSIVNSCNVFMYLTKMTFSNQLDLFWAQCYKTFLFVIYGFLSQARVLVSAKYCQPSLILLLWVRPGAYPRVEYLKGALFI
jgi:hypothetical protein